MAIKQMMLDDFDGTPITEGAGGTVSFAFKGVHYEIDLTAENEEKLSAALAPFIEKARETEAPEYLEAVVPEVDPAIIESAKRLAKLDEERGKVLRAQAERNLAAGKKPYDTVEARRWLTERGYESNPMGPLSKQYREIYEQHFGLPSYDLAPKHPKA